MGFHIIQRTSQQEGFDRNITFLFRTENNVSCLYMEALNTHVHAYTHSFNVSSTYPIHLYCQTDLESIGGLVLCG